MLVKIVKIIDWINNYFIGTSKTEVRLSSSDIKSIIVYVIIFRDLDTLNQSGICGWVSVAKRWVSRIIEVILCLQQVMCVVKL